MRFAIKNDLFFLCFLLVFPFACDTGVTMARCQSAGPHEREGATFGLKALRVSRKSASGPAPCVSGKLEWTLYLHERNIKTPFLGPWLQGSHLLNHFRHFRFDCAISEVSRIFESMSPLFAKNNNFFY